MNISALAEAEKLLFIARQSLSEGKLPQAIDMLNKIVTDYPDFSKAHITLRHNNLQHQKHKKQQLHHRPRARRRAHRADAAPQHGTGLRVR